MDELTGTQAIAALYAMALLPVGVFASAREFSREAASRPGNPLPTWNIRWWEFLALIALVATLALFIQLVASSATTRWKHHQALEPWRLPLLATVFQGTILAVLAAAFFGPYDFKNIALSPRRHDPPHPLATGAGDFLAAVPLVVVVSLGWQQILSLLENLGYPIPLERQTLVLVLAGEGSSAVVAVLGASAVILAPLAEELLFRGAIYRFLKGRWAPRAAMIISSLGFAWLHGNLRSFLPLFLLGMLLCRSYEKRQNLLAPICFHALFNANSVLLILLDADNIASDL